MRLIITLITNTLLALSVLPTSGSKTKQFASICIVSIREKMPKLGNSPEIQHSEKPHYIVYDTGFSKVIRHPPKNFWASYIPIRTLDSNFGGLEAV